MERTRRDKWVLFFHTWTWESIQICAYKVPLGYLTWIQERKELNALFITQLENQPPHKETTFFKDATKALNITKHKHLELHLLTRER